MKYYTLTIAVDQDQLATAYAQAHNLQPDEFPDTESMILSELAWLNHSGISTNGDLTDCDCSIFIQWSIDHLRYRAETLGLSLSDDEYLGVPEYLKNKYDDRLEIFSDEIDTAIDYVKHQ